MTRVNLKESILQFWTAPRLNNAIRILNADKTVQEATKRASTTNVVGKLIAYTVVLCILSLYFHFFILLLNIV